MINPNQPDFTNHPAHPSRHTPGLHLSAWNDTPVLTIVTPFYNTGAVFHETAHSLLNQSLQQWEWLIINDGTNDPSALRILGEYRHRDPRIRIIDHAENRGLSIARNTGFSHARCEYVLLLDSDDLLEPTAAEKWWWFLETHPEFGFVASYHVAFGGMNYLWTGGFHDGLMNAERNRVSMMCMVRKSVFDAVGGFDESMRGGLEDWDFWMKCAAHGYWGATIPEFLAWYRLRADHSDRWENLQEARLNEFQSIIKHKYPHLFTGGFPVIQESTDHDLTLVNLDIPEFNHLENTQPHLLVILPWLVMGGAERFILNLMDQLIGRGWMVSIVTTAQSDNAWLYEFEQRTPSIFMLPNFIPIKEYPRFLGYLLQSRRFDAILVQGSLEGYRLIPSLRHSSPAIPILDFIHFITPDWMQGGFPRLSLLYHHLIDFSFTGCQQVRDWMAEAGANPDKLEACYIGVDTRLWKPDPAARQRVRTELGIGPDEVVIIYAARLEAQKQPHVFVKALCMLKQRGDQFRALVAGEGSLMAPLKAELQACGLQASVNVLGGVPSGKMPELMAASDIFFLPSQNEGISQAIYEAMACGLVVVGAQVGGQGELVTPDCGCLYLPQLQQDEVAEYADILHGLIHDRPRRRAMSQASRKRTIERFSLPLMGECIHRDLLSVIENKKSSIVQSTSAPERAAIEREARTVVEYLQARQDLRKVSRQLSSMVIPRQPSHWFYLWLRQLFLPMAERVKTTYLGRIMVGLQKWIKRVLIKPR